MPPAVKSVKYVITLVVIALLLAAGVFTWQRHASSDPRVQFWSALQTSLSSQGITCNLAKPASNAAAGEAGISTVQTIQLNLKNKTDVRAVTTLKQSKTSVTTEQLDTKTNSYIRYTSIVGAAGQPDVSKALNVWSKAQAASSADSLYGRTALGNCVVPLADLGSRQVGPIMKTLQAGKIFTPDFTHTTITSLSGAKVRVYSVSVQARPYIDLMKQVATLAGLHTLDSIQAASYDDKPAEHMKFYIASRPDRIQKITYDGSGQSVSFTDYGKLPVIVVPKQTITADQLQKRLEGN